MIDITTSCLRGSVAKPASLPMERRAAEPVASPLEPQCPYGLDSATANLLRNLIGYAQRHDLPAPRVISGKRSRAQQQALQWLWNRGHRLGIGARPADDSAHLTGQAFDLGNTFPVLQAFGHEAARLGARWGGNFIPPDPGHFDTR